MVMCSALLIYQDKLHDLLAGKKKAGGDGKPLKVTGKEGTDRGIFVQGLTQKPLTEAAHATKWMQLAEKNRRAKAKELMAGDRQLKRASTVVMYEILQVVDKGEKGGEKGKGGKGGKAAPKGGAAGGAKDVYYSCTTFVDMAGSTSSPATDGVKKKEDIACSKGITALNNCLLAQVKLQNHKPGKGKRAPLVPWNGSNLTKLLKDKIGGNNLTIMLGALSPAQGQLKDSKNTIELLQISRGLRQPPLEDRAKNVSRRSEDAPLF